MPVPVLLRGRWVDPSGTPRAGRIQVRRRDDHRAGDAVWTGTSRRTLDGDGALPEIGGDALRVEAPDTGGWVYDVVERLDGDEPRTYRIRVTATDGATGYDLTAVTS